LNQAYGSCVGLCYVRYMYAWYQDLIFWPFNYDILDIRSSLWTTLSYAVEDCMVFCFLGTVIEFFLDYSCYNCLVHLHVTINISTKYELHTIFRLWVISHFARDFAYSDIFDSLTFDLFTYKKLIRRWDTRTNVFFIYDGHTRTTKYTALFPHPYTIYRERLICGC